MDERKANILWETMRIGIDTTALPSQPVGAGNYIIELTHALLELHPEVEWVLFVQESKRALLGIAETPKVHIVSIADRARPIRLLWEQVTLPRLARRWKLDLLHCLHYTMPLFPTCPTIVTLHDMTFFLYPQLHTVAKRFFFRFFIRWSAQHAGALIAVSESTRQDALRLLPLAANRITATPLGVKSEFIHLQEDVRLDLVRQKYHLPEKFILNVGLLEPRKNLPALLRAFQQIAPHFPDHRLAMVGRLGWMYEEIFKLVEELHLTEKVVFPGYVDAEDLPAVYTLAEVFVYPTLYEGFGLPALEAMACGTPVITSRSSALPEIVGDAGILVTPGDEVELAGALRNVLTDQTLRARLSEAGIQRAALFTWQRTASLTWQVYEQLLSEGKRV